MIRTAHLCDLCVADGEVTLADGQYTTDEGNRFDGCEYHLEEAKGYGFATRDYPGPGNIDPDTL